MLPERSWGICNRTGTRPDRTPNAHVLEERGVPFLFVTGYGQAALSRDRPNREACTKPFHPDHLTT